MATHTLTKAAPQQDFVLTNDGDVQVVISGDSKFTSFASFELQYETATPSVFIPVPETRTSDPYSRIYTFKAGTIRVIVVGADDDTSVVVDIK